MSEDQNTNDLPEGQEPFAKFWQTSKLDDVIREVIQGTSDRNLNLIGIYTRANDKYQSLVKKTKSFSPGETVAPLEYYKAEMTRFLYEYFTEKKSQNQTISNKELETKLEEFAPKDFNDFLKSDSQEARYNAYKEAGIVEKTIETIKDKVEKARETATQKQEQKNQSEADQERSQKNGQAIKQQAWITLGAVGFGMLAEARKNAKEAQTADKDQPKKKQSWFRSKTAMVLAGLATILALDIGYSFANRNHRPIVGKFTDMLAKQGIINQRGRDGV